jgi:LysM repeat protein
MRAFKLISIAILASAIGLSTACSRHSSTDDAVAKDIQTKVAADPATKDSNVTVDATDGKVKLTGTVSSTAAQQKLEEIAKAEPGNVSVDDETSIQSAAAVAATVAAPVEAPKPEPIVVPAGTVLTVRVGQSLSSKTSQSGQVFLATLAQPVSVAGTTAMPTGSKASGTVVSAKQKGKLKGQGELNLELTSITVSGQSYPIHTRVLENVIKGKGKRTAAATGGGAAGGALIGGVAGGGKGAGIGALVGAGAGLIGGTMTGNQQIEIPAESALSFRLSAPVTLPAPQ